MYGDIFKVLAPYLGKPEGRMNATAVICGCTHVGDLSSVLPHLMHGFPNERRKDVRWEKD
jgi:hypothetical protein